MSNTVDEIAVVYFGARVAWKDLKYTGTWFVVVSWIHIAFQCLGMVLSNMMILNALLDIGNGRWWNVQDRGYSYSKILYYMSQIFGKNVLEVFVVFIVPLVQSQFLACHGLQTHHVTFQIIDNKDSIKKDTHDVQEGQQKD